MKTTHRAKTVQLEHSQAKVALYAEYLSIYLNILSRASNVSKVYIFDLMCGEGVYEDGSTGSALTGLKKIRDFCFANKQLQIPIEIWLNDNGISLIEKERRKIERVREAAKKISLPSYVHVEFFDEDFQDIFKNVVPVIQGLDKSRAFVFIDPHGYKDVRAFHVKSLLEGGKSEVLLFLPATFLYRFADKSADPNFHAGEPLADFITDLFQAEFPVFSSIEDFIHGLKAQFKKYLPDQNVFVDTFTIQRDVRNLYCLYFFTSNKRGFQKMLEVKWRLDEERGSGFRLEKTGNLFSDIELNQYPKKLLEYLGCERYRTNEEFFLFGLESGYLPKHTRAALELLEEEGHGFEVTPLDHQSLQRKAFHIGDEKRRIAIKVKR